MSLTKVKSHYELNLINNYTWSKDPKLFQYIRNITKSNSFPSVLKYNHITVDTDLDKANVFNEYFYSVFTDGFSDPLNVDDLPQPQLDNQLADITITQDEVFSTLNTNKTSDSDNISPVLLKFCASFLTHPLHYICFPYLYKQVLFLVNGKFTPLNQFSSQMINRMTKITVQFHY